MTLSTACPVNSTALNTSEASYFETLFHVTHIDSSINIGSLYLSSGVHPVTSGLPSSLHLEGDLGSQYVDIFAPYGDSQHVSAYDGDYVG